MWIPLALELAQGDRPLGEALEHQEVEVTPFDQLDRGVDPIVGEAGAGTDSDAPGHPSMIRRKHPHGPRSIVT